jgi:hypothetical protein
VLGRLLEEVKIDIDDSGVSIESRLMDNNHKQFFSEAREGLKRLSQNGFALEGTIFATGISFIHSSNLSSY